MAYALFNTLLELNAPSILCDVNQICFEVSTCSQSIYLVQKRPNYDEDKAISNSNDMRQCNPCHRRFSSGIK